ncbi:S-layer homology domain-containing protein, partial [Paenibacillus sp. MCAF20]
DGTVYVLSSNKLYALGKVGVDNVLLNKASLTLEAGSSDVLLATVAPDNAVNKNVVWESSNPAIATVNAQGKVTGIAEGTAIITVRTVERGRSDTAAVVVAAGAAPEAFTDTSGHWASSYIEEAVKKGITKGYPNGTFRPNGNITRAEFAVMLMNGLKPDVQGSALGFKDKAAIGSWAVKAVSQAVQLGIISGYTDGTFQPAKNISHTEMAAMIVRASGLATPEVATTGYTDDAAIPQWAKKAVAAGKAHGILVVGGEDSQVFMPKALTTRAEAVSSIVKMLQLIE